MGYRFTSKLSLSFDFDPERLRKALEKLSKSEVNSNISINFTVKDKESIKNQLLVAAARDAKNKEKRLCFSLGSKLGQLVNIKYNWDEI